MNGNTINYLHLSEVVWLEKGAIVKRPGKARLDPPFGEDVQCTYFMLITSIDPDYEYALALQVGVADGRVVNPITTDVISDVIREDWYIPATDEERAVALPLFADECQRKVDEIRERLNEWQQLATIVTDAGRRGTIG